MDPRVEQRFASFPQEVRDAMLELRAQIFDVADELQCGPLEETLRWGEPAYLTTASRTGTTLRIDSKDPGTGRYSLFVHCQTDLIARFAERHGDRFLCDGTRAVHFDVSETPPAEAVQELIGLALTYKVRKSAERRRQASR